jgi:HepA-related protein (HARP)
MSQSETSLSIEEILNCIGEDEELEVEELETSKDETLDDRLRKELCEDIYSTKITFSPMDFNMFEIAIVPYNNDVIAICRNTMGREYDYNNKTWSFPNNQYNELHKKICRLPRVTVLRELSQAEVSKIQIVIVSNTADGELVIKLPFNENFNTMIRNNGGQYLKNQQSWAIPLVNKVDFFKKLERLRVSTINAQEKKKSKFISIYLYYTL